MNLSDEIKQVCMMWLKPAFGNGTKDESKWMVKDIMEIFEKRIDSKLKILRKLNPPEKEIIFTQGYNSAIYDIMEMLK